MGATRVPLDALLAASDVVSIHLVPCERTRGLLGARELSLLKPSAYLLNTSRGPIVDEAALVAALREQRIAGAGLDVSDDEPLARAHPLRSLPNTVLTPHLGYVTAETYRVFYEHALEDILAWLAGAPGRVRQRRDARYAARVDLAVQPRWRSASVARQCWRAVKRMARSVAPSLAQRRCAHRLASLQSRCFSVISGACVRPVVGHAGCT